LRPAAKPDGQIATESSEVLPAWTPTASFIFQQANNLGARYTNASPWTIDKRSTAHLLFAVGLFKHLEFGVHVPLLLNQDGTHGPGQTALVPTAFGDARATLKGTIFHLPARGVGIGALVDIYAPTGEQRALMSTGGYGFAAQLLAEHRTNGGITNTFNLGYRARKDTSANRYTLGDTLTYRLATALPFGPQLNFAAQGELDGSLGLVDHSDAPLAIRAGLRWRMRSGMVLAALGGVNAISTLGAGDVHLLLRVGWVSPAKIGAEPAFHGARRKTARALVRDYERTFAPVEKPAEASHSPDDLDGDEVLGQLDACPRVAEDRDGFEDGDGCPEFDNDRDAILDALDLCPLVPEIINGVKDWDGCPDLRLNDGKARSLAQLDWQAIFPEFTVEGFGNDLDPAAREQLSNIAEILRLNPWIGRLELHLLAAQAPQPDSTGSAGSEAIVSQARARAHAIEQYLWDRGVEKWRIHFPPRQLDALAAQGAASYHLRIEVVGTPSGLRPLAPSPALLQDLLDAAEKAGREAQRLENAGRADPSQHLGSPTPRVDTSAINVPASPNKR
jgi:hypothetical protein